MGRESGRGGDKDVPALGRRTGAQRNEATPLRRADRRPELGDPLGRRCPIGSHIRRANPRSSRVARQRPVAPHRLPGAAVPTAASSTCPERCAGTSWQRPTSTPPRPSTAACSDGRSPPSRASSPTSRSTTASRPNGGMRTPQPGEPANWLVYFATDDADGSMASVEELGGNRLAGRIRPADGPDRDRPGPAGRRVRALRGRPRTTESEAPPAVLAGGAGLPQRRGETASAGRNRRPHARAHRGHALEGPQRAGP
jgi:hypothetical protein